MSDELELAADDLLAGAYRAERAVTAHAVGAVSREALLVAAYDRVLAARPAVPAAAARPRSRKPLLAGLAAAFGIGALAFAAGRVTAPRSEPPAAIGAPPGAPADARIDVDAAPPDAAAAAVVPVAPVHPAPPPPAHTEPAPLSEPLLIDQARAALRRHLPAEAKTALDRHRAQYPNGQLREDRDVLLIEVALAEDRLADANELIAGYEARYPRGGLRARVAELQHQLDARIGTHGR